MFAPFRHKDGSAKTLHEVDWEDLDQLQALDEGFALEFKRTYNGCVQRKIPKIIASFANSRGGWLVVGIEDVTKAVCPIERPGADFSQTIGELCRRHVSPTPQFDCRFIADPNDRAQGVLIVQVFEGTFPPYVADGVVEVREGSTSGPAASDALVELYGKATKRRTELESFCRRTVFFPGDADPTKRVPLFNLYLPKINRHGVQTPSRSQINAHVEAMRASFAQQNMGCHVQHAHDSRIVRASSLTGTADVHSAIELFHDESIKLTVPAILIEGKDRMDAIGKLLGIGFTVDEGIRLIDAQATLSRATSMASTLDRYVRERGIAWQEYAIAYELEGMEGAILWSFDPVYLRYIERHGILFCGTSDCTSRMRYLDDGAHDSFRARQFAGSHFFEACGLPLGTDDAEDNELVDALLHVTR